MQLGSQFEEIAANSASVPERNLFWVRQGRSPANTTWGVVPTFLDVGLRGESTLQGFMNSFTKTLKNEQSTMKELALAIKVEPYVLPNVDADGWCC